MISARTLTTRNNAVYIEIYLITHDLQQKALDHLYFHFQLHVDTTLKLSITKYCYSIKFWILQFCLVLNIERAHYFHFLKHWIADSGFNFVDKGVECITKAWIFSAFALISLIVDSSTSNMRLKARFPSPSSTLCNICSFVSSVNAFLWCLATFSVTEEEDVGCLGPTMHNTVQHKQKNEKHFGCVAIN